MVPCSESKVIQRKSKEDVLTKHFLSYLNIKKDNQIISHEKLSLKEHSDALVCTLWLGIEVPTHNDLLWEKKIFTRLKNSKVFKNTVAIHGICLSHSFKYITLLISHHDTD